MLLFFGRHSANIFYIHSFVRGIWLKNMAYSFHSAWMIVVFVFAATLIISMFTEAVSSKSGYDRLTGKWIKKATEMLSQNM